MKRDPYTLQEFNDSSDYERDASLELTDRELFYVWLECGPVSEDQETRLFSPDFPYADEVKRYAAIFAAGDERRRIAKGIPEEWARTNRYPGNCPLSLGYGDQMLIIIWGIFGALVFLAFTIFILASVGKGADWARRLCSSSCVAS